MVHSALIFSSIFYFIFHLIAWLVMGLQRLFSATISVVGLFISVDYGLCDEFRCRGQNITVNIVHSSGTGSTVSHELLANTTKSIAWQGHAFWTLVYLAGIALWTLHLSLFEAFIQSTPTVSSFILHSYFINVLLVSDFLFSFHFHFRLHIFFFPLLTYLFFNRAL